MAYIPSVSSADSVISDALSIASGGDNDIANVLNDIKSDSTLDKNSVDISNQRYVTVYDWDGLGMGHNLTAPITTLDQAMQYVNDNPSLYWTASAMQVGNKFYAMPASATDRTPLNYGVVLTNDLNISEASGAMVIDDLMQKISTKVQVAAQMLSTSNNIAKTASRILSQG